MANFAAEVLKINPDITFAKAGDIALTAKYTSFDVPQDAVIQMTTRRYKVAAIIVSMGAVPAIFIWLFGWFEINNLLAGLIFSLGLFGGMVYEYIVSSKQQLRIVQLTYKDHLNLVPEDVQLQIGKLQQKFPDLCVNAVGYSKKKTVNGIAYICIYYEDQVVMFYLHPDLREGPYEISM